MTLETMLKTHIIRTSWGSMQYPEYIDDEGRQYQYVGKNDKHQLAVFRSWSSARRDNSELVLLPYSAHCKTALGFQDYQYFKVEKNHDLP